MSSFFNFIGSFFSSFTSNACMVVFIDEPEMPKHMIK